MIKLFGVFVVVFALVMIGLAGKMSFFSESNDLRSQLISNGLIATKINDNYQTASLELNDIQ